MLEKLQEFPHPHIVTHLLTWEHSKEFYMLFPCAKCHLGTFMDDQNAPQLSLEEGNVLWFFKQLQGIADAVRHIHNFGGEAINPEARDGVEMDLLGAAATPQQAGFHHDLKPENILVFEDEDMRLGVFKISDFGAGKVNQLRANIVSMKVSQSTVTPTYASPDKKVNGRLSRPYDMWSIGCIFLELLVWLLVEDRAARLNFVSERVGLEEAMLRRKEELQMTHSGGSPATEYQS